MASPAAEIVSFLSRRDDVLVASHYNPDGDAVGSMAAMGHILKALGKRFTLYNVSGLPESFDWLSLPAPVATSLPAAKPGTIVCLDCGDEARVGGELAREVRAAKVEVVNIDHHLGNPMFGNLNWVDTNFASTTQMAAELAAAAGLELTGALGEAVYLGLVTDTGYFSYSNATPETMELAAKIVRLGLDPGEINARIQNQWTLSRIRLMNAALSELSIFHHGRVGVISVTRAMIAEAGATPQDTEGLINWVRRLRGVRIAAALREEEDGRIKFSLRSTGSVNVQQIAAVFGGGGHKNASGGEIRKSMAKAREKLVAECVRYLEEG